jgi:predicted DNA-binding protein
MADNQRVERINLRVTEDMRDRLELLSKRMGMPTSTIAVLAIAEYLDAKNRQKEQMEMVSAAIADEFSAVFSDPDKIRAVFAMSEQAEGDLHKQLELK